MELETGIEKVQVLKGKRREEKERKRKERQGRDKAGTRQGREMSKDTGRTKERTNLERKEKNRSRPR